MNQIRMSRGRAGGKNNNRGDGGREDKAGGGALGKPYHGAGLMKSPTFCGVSG